MKSPMSNPVQFDRLDQSLRRWPRASLAHLPTPIDALSRLSSAYSPHQLFLKRDDCTGLAMGGNKARQLEFYLGDAMEQGCDVVLSTGAIQSNYMRTLAAAAAKLGLECHIQLEARVDNVSEDYLHSGNVLLDKLFGAHIHYFDKGEDEFAADKQINQLAQSFADKGRKPYVVPLAPVDQPKGALGYVLAAREIMAQIIDQNLSIDLIVVGSGSGLTHAGLLTGLRLMDVQIPVLGACVRRDAGQQHGRILSTCEKVSRMLECEGIVGSDDVWVDDVALAPGYGKASPEVMAAIAEMAKYEGILLDPVYSAKTIGAALQLIKQSQLSAYRNILMIHTGGTPALFAYRDALQNAPVFSAS